MDNPANLQPLPSKQTLVDAFGGKHITDLRTPALIVDRAIVRRNCAHMHRAAKELGVRFRAHIKTHKTTEGTRMQLSSAEDVTHAIVVSTLMEAWKVLEEGLVADGTVRDVLYGLPVAVTKIPEIHALATRMRAQGGVLRLLVDHAAQLNALETYFDSVRTEERQPWPVFVKVDPGYKRAGVVPVSQGFDDLVRRLLTSPAFEVYGFYCHAGHSYGSKSTMDAESFLQTEVDTVNTAAQRALLLAKDTKHNTRLSARLVLSVGSTPTAHACPTITEELRNSLVGDLELHAGNYLFHDLQQLATSLIQPEAIAHRVLATVVSYYPGRGSGGTDEAMIDVGGIGLSKDVGPIPGYGRITGVFRRGSRVPAPPVEGRWMWAETQWAVGRISQEHGVMVERGGGEVGQARVELEVGDVVAIVGQHACLITANHPWVYVVDSDDGKAAERGERVVDVWVPWKGW